MYITTKLFQKWGCYHQHFCLQHLSPCFISTKFIHYIHYIPCAYADPVPLYSQFIGQLILLAKLSLRFALLLLFGNSTYMRATSLDAKLFKNYVIIHNTMQLCKTKASLWLLEGPIRICTTGWWMILCVRYISSDMKIIEIHWRNLLYINRS